MTISSRLYQVWPYLTMEVATLARLQHQHRYYKAWYETGLVDNLASTALGSKTSVTPSFSYKDTGSSDQFGHENMLESTYLYSNGILLKVSYFLIFIHTSLHFFEDERKLEFAQTQGLVYFAHG